MCINFTCVPGALNAIIKKRQPKKRIVCLILFSVCVCVCGQQHSSSNITFFSFIHSQFSRSLWPSSPLSLFLSLSFYKKCSISFASRHAKFRRDFIRVKKKKGGPRQRRKKGPLRSTRIYNLIFYIACNNLFDKTLELEERKKTTTHRAAATC